MVVRGGCHLLPNFEDTKPELEPIQIWRCKSNECKAWMREEFVSAGTEPECPLCKGPMIRGFKHLPKLVKRYKSSGKKAKEFDLVHS